MNPGKEMGNGISECSLGLLGSPVSSAGKESTCNAGDPCLIHSSGRSPGEGIGYLFQYSWNILVFQMVKNLPAMWEIWVRSLAWEDPLEKGKAPVPVFWPGEFHGEYSPWGCKEQTRLLSDFNFTIYIIMTGLH